MSEEEMDQILKELLPEAIKAAVQAVETGAVRVPSTTRGIVVEIRIIQLNHEEVYGG